MHIYGAHIFHTNNKEVWDYITKFAEFNRFTNSPVANYKGELYSLPFTMYTFNKMWGVVTPEEAAAAILSKVVEEDIKVNGENLETPKKDVEIKKGDCIGQAIFMPFLIADRDEATGTRTGGFGSTSK